MTWLKKADETVRIPGADAITSEEAEELTAHKHYKMINTNDPNDEIGLVSTTLEEALQEALAHAGYQLVEE